MVNPYQPPLDIESSNIQATKRQKNWRANLLAIIFGLMGLVGLAILGHLLDQYEILGSHNDSKLPAKTVILMISTFVLVGSGACFGKWLGNLRFGSSVHSD